MSKNIGSVNKASNYIQLNSVKDYSLLTEQKNSSSEDGQGNIFELQNYVTDTNFDNTKAEELISGSYIVNYTNQTIYIDVPVIYLDLKFDKKLESWTIECTGRLNIRNVSKYIKINNVREGSTIENVAEHVKINNIFKGCKITNISNNCTLTNIQDDVAIDVIGKDCKFVNVGQNVEITNYDKNSYHLESAIKYPYITVDEVNFLIKKGVKIFIIFYSIVFFSNIVVGSLYSKIDTINVLFIYFINILYILILPMFYLFLINYDTKEI